MIYDDTDFDVEKKLRQRVEETRERREQRESAEDTSEKLGEIASVYIECCLALFSFGAIMFAISFCVVLGGRLAMELVF